MGVFLITGVYIMKLSKVFLISLAIVSEGQASFEEADSLTTKQTVQSSERMVIKDGISLWTEAFGNPKADPIMLVMGLSTQGIFWSEEFCHKLATHNYYVIRYDHRDVGKSTHIDDYDENPYDIKTFAHDAVAILDAYKIKKASFLGNSMGGMILQFIGAHHPKRVKTLILNSTSPDVIPFLNETNEEGEYKSDFSSPKASHKNWQMQVEKKKDREIEDDAQFFMDLWRILFGREEAMDDADYKLLQALGVQAGQRGTDALLNHRTAMLVSAEEGKQIPPKIKARTLVLHGRMDPVFPVDHAEGLHRMLPNSELLIYEDMGHFFEVRHYDRMIKHIDEFIRKAE